MSRSLPAVFCAAQENDLVRVLRGLDYEIRTFSDAEEAIQSAACGEAVLILADKYPARGTALTEEALAAARSKELKIYIEFPDSLPGWTGGEAHETEYERLVVQADFPGALKENDILMVNSCWYRELPLAGHCFVALAKVAGYDTAVYGLPEKYCAALGYLDERQDVLAAATALTNFVTGRYAPTAAWRALWEMIFAQLGLDIVELKWKTDVGIEAGEMDELPADAAERAAARNVEWMYSHMVTHSHPNIAVLEGFESAINCRGYQFMRDIIRADCQGEAAMEMAYGWLATGDPGYRKISAGLTDHVLNPKVFLKDDPRSSMYGLCRWFNTNDVFYGDDNARMLLGVLSAREVLGDDRWDERILRCVLANLRTSGRNGLRWPRLETSSFEKKSWLDYYNEEPDFVAPHYQAYLWAAFIWMYELTGLDELLIKSERGIEQVMERFPDRIRWQNTLTGEVARMLLPLSFLQRVNPSDRHRKWLRQAVDALLAYQQPCGALQDAFGDLSLGSYPPPQSNEGYGTTEASLIQQNGDPATDLLYATNWAFIGLWEAWLVLKDKRIFEAYSRLRDFLLRIQVRSAKHPELDGTWMRSFDYEKWEYWGSAADVGWSAWSVETGWVNAWIATTLMLEQRGESMMKTSSRSSFRALADELYREMMTPCFE